ncbi:MAG: MarR family winged helix-turn-helix transcriptional regulator [Chloroflexota bacterium]|nr:MarR family winged helix-turn-helix transcriptional regulator [Chloroflexota bacterium]
MSASSQSFQKTLHTVLGQIMHLYMHNFWHFAKEQGLSIAQMITLRQVYHQDTASGCSISDISEWLGVTNAAVSQSLDKLVNQGLVKRQENPQDRRSKQILLTSQGEDMLKKSMQAQQSWLEDLTNHLTPEEQTQIETAFRLLIEKITDME